MGGARKWTLSLLAFAAGLAVPAPAGAAETLFGFDDTPEAFAVRAKAAKHAGAEIARLPVSWERAEPRPGRYDFSWLDSAVTALGTQGIRPVFVISAAPTWAAPQCDRSVTQTCAVGEGYEHAYAALALELLHRYRGSQVQAWNEPNLDGFGAISAERVAELTNVLVHVAPRKVIGPAASPGKPDYLGYTARAYRHIDRRVALAIHLYPRSVFRAQRLDEDWGRVQRIAGRRQIWVTEIGFSVYEFGAAGQARHSVAAYRFLASHGAHAVIFHSLQDQVETDNDWLATLGVVHADGVRKPAYHALRRAVASVG
jgi:hypothetical protein